MAVSKVGNTYSQTTVGDGSIESIEVHSSCEVSIIVGTGCGGASFAIDVLNWDQGVDVETGWVQIKKIAGADPNSGVDSYYMLESHANHPAAGAVNQILTWGFNNHKYGGGAITLFFLDGVDTSSLITDTDSGINASAGTGWTSGSLSVGADDMAIVAGAVYYRNPAGDSGQTNIYVKQDQCHVRVDYEVGEDTPGFTWVSSALWAAIAFGINAAAAGTGVEIFRRRIEGY